MLFWVGLARGLIIYFPDSGRRKENRVLAIHQLMLGRKTYSIGIPLLGFCVQGTVS